MTEIESLKSMIDKLEKRVDHLEKHIVSEEYFLKDMVAYIVAEGAEKDRLRQEIKANYPT